jgi:hypothetical protein
LKKRIKLSSISLLTIFALIASCEHQNNITPPPNILNTSSQVTKTQLKGKTEFPDSNDFKTKAILGDISNQATVSIIYLPNHPTLANQTAVTGLTDTSGNFSINPSASFTPAVNDAFILEAEKRIGRGGQEKLAISTYIRWNGTGWDSMTSPGIIINSKTTALTIIAGLNTGTITVANTLSKIVNGVPQNINGTVTAQTVTDVAALVTTILTANHDPVHYIGLQNGSYITVNPQPVPTPVPVGEFKVNTYTTGMQYNSSVDTDSNGNFVITWNSTDQNGTSGEIYAQRYNNSGGVVGSEFKVNLYTSNRQDYPSVAVDSDGDFVITWMSGLQDGNGYGIYAKRYNSSGVAISSEFKVNTYTASNQINPNIAMDSGGDFVITWNSKDQDGPSGYGIYAQRYNSLGVAQGGEFQVNTYVTGFQIIASIAMDSDGDFIISWRSKNQDGSEEGIYAQRYNADGSKPAVNGTEFRVNTYTTGAQYNPSIAMDTDGDFIVSWHSYGVGHSGIYAQRYSSSGGMVGTEFKVNTYSSASPMNSSKVLLDNDGDFVIAWNSKDQDGSGYGVYAQRYGSTGLPAGIEFRVNTYTTNAQGYSAAAIDSFGDFVITWHGYGAQDSSSYGVYAKRYDASGNPK